MVPFVDEAVLVDSPDVVGITNGDLDELSGQHFPLLGVAVKLMDVVVLVGTNNGTIMANRDVHELSGNLIYHC